MIEVKTELHTKNEARQATSPEEPARQPLNSQSFPENFYDNYPISRKWTQKKA